MTERVKRRYHAPRRKEQARATRRAILDAAVELFTTQGFAVTTIRQVAQRAAVSEQSVYHAFGDKIGLLQAAGNDYASLSAGEAEAAFLVALEAEPDPVERIRKVAHSSRMTWEGGAAELELAVFRPEVRDPRLEQLAETSLAYKHANTRDVCRILFPDGIRRKGLGIDQIAAFATAVDSAATVATIRSLGWSMNDWEAWVAQLLMLFLEPEIVARHTPRPDGIAQSANQKRRPAARMLGP